MIIAGYKTTLKEIIQKPSLIQKEKRTGQHQQQFSTFLMRTIDAHK
jgi:hypothetical protein